MSQKVENIMENTIIIEIDPIIISRDYPFGKPSRLWGFSIIFTYLT